MQETVMQAVTGSFGFTGRAITRLLLEKGERVLNLTGHPDRQDELSDKVESVAFDFEQPHALAETLRGVDTLYNTYWIRFAHGNMTFDKAIRNSRTLIGAAKSAGVRRIVHISITNPSAASPLPYFRGKAVIEQAIKDSGLSYAILRPAVIFGDKGILINNLAWFLRHLPVFTIPGDGEYKLQPILVEDLAELAVKAGQSDENAIIDAVGPEKFRFNELMALIKRTVNSRTFIFHLHPTLAYFAASSLNPILRDVALTRDEVRGLMSNLLVSDQPATGHTALSEWLTENADWIGTRYMSELRKHYR